QVLDRQGLAGGRAGQLRVRRKRVPQGATPRHHEHHDDQTQPSHADSLKVSVRENRGESSDEPRPDGLSAQTAESQGEGRRPPAAETARASPLQPLRRRRSDAPADPGSPRGAYAPPVPQFPPPT